MGKLAGFGRSILLRLTLFILIFVLWSSFPNPVEAASPIYVRPDGHDTNCNGSADVSYPGSGGPGLDCAVQTIQAGINLVDAGGTVRVAAGTYLHTTSINVNRSVTIQGVGREQTIIQGDYGTNRWWYLFNVTAASHVTFRDMTITAVNGELIGSYTYGYLIGRSSGDGYTSTNNLTIDNVHFLAGRRALFAKGNDLIIRNCLFTGNWLRANIELGGGSFLIEHNDFESRHYQHGALITNGTDEISGVFQHNNVRSNAIQGWFRDNGAVFAIEFYNDNLGINGITLNDNDFDGAFFNPGLNQLGNPISNRPLYVEYWQKNFTPARLSFTDNRVSGYVSGIFVPLTSIVEDNAFSNQSSNHIRYDRQGQTDSAIIVAQIESVLASNTFDKGVYNAGPGIESFPGIWTTIARGIAAASAGDMIKVISGVYNENVTIDKRLTLRGAGSDPAGTVISQTQAGAGDSRVGVVQITASGLSNAEPILLQNLRIEPDRLAGISIGRFTEATGQNIAYIRLDNVKVIGTNTNPNSEQERGLYVDLTSSLRHLVVENSAFDNLTYGWYLNKQVSADVSTVQYVTVTNTTFNHNNLKGIYAEKLSDATFMNCVVENNGFSPAGVPPYFLPWMAGIDINLKAGTYRALTFTHCTVTGNALAVGAVNGVGLTAKARDDGSSYDVYTATLSSITINGGNYSGNRAGIRFGEPGKSNVTPTGVQVRNATLTGNLDYAVSHQAQGNVTLAGNTLDEHTRVFLQTAGNLVAYANNITNFNTAGLTDAAGAFNARHNWWGAHTGQPAGVDNDSWRYRLGARVASWADGNSAATLGGAGLSGGVGIAVIVSHGRGLENTPFANGSVPDADQTCSAYYDFFTVGGDGGWTVSVPIDDNDDCNTNTLNQKHLYWIPAITACNGTATPSCWALPPDVAISGQNLVASGLTATMLDGTPFVAGESSAGRDPAGNQPTAITLVAFDAVAQDNVILLTWETAMELGNVGFNLYRSTSPAGPYTRLNETLIPPQNPGSVIGAVYEWPDTDAQPGVTYFYKLEDLDMKGVRTFHGPVTATVQPTLSNRNFTVFLPLVIRQK